MQDLTEETFFEFIGQDGVNIVDFYASWCGPCQRFLAIAERVEEALGQVGAQIAKMDIEEQKDIVGAYSIRNVPTFIFFKNGQEVQRYSGIKQISEMISITESV